MEMLGLNTFIFTWVPGCIFTFCTETLAPMCYFFKVINWEVLWLCLCNLPPQLSWAVVEDECFQCTEFGLYLFARTLYSPIREEYRGNTTLWKTGIYWSPYTDSSQEKNACKVVPYTCWKKRMRAREAKRETEQLRVLVKRDTSNF